MGLSSPSFWRAARRDPHAARLTASWIVIASVITAMVVIPLVLYLHGKAIRTDLTEVATLELATERVSRAMANRERALRAYLYQRETRHLDEYESASDAVDGALDDAEELAAADTRATAALAALRSLAEDWDVAADAVVARAEAGEADVIDDEEARPGPIYDRFQQTASRLIEGLESEKSSLVDQLARADDLRLAMPFVLMLLGVPVMLYIAQLSRRVLGLLSAAQAERERLAAILEHMVDPVLVTDVGGHVTLANPAARELLAVRPGAHVGALVSRLEKTDAAEAVSPRAILDAIAATQPLAAADAIVRGDVGGERSGEGIPVSVSSAPIGNGADVTGAVTVLRDLSDRVRYEQERLKSERFSALGSMAERLAHEFGNYLEAASGATMMLERPSAADPANRAKWAGLIRTTIDEGRNVLSGLRTLSFISHRAPRFFPVDLSALVSRACEVAKLARPDAKVAIERDVIDGVIVDASEADLLRAMVNVVVNAIDAMRDGGTIVVRLFRDAAGVHVAVVDRGIGIAGEDLEKIFGMYFTTKGERGSGMGLTLAREVLRLHGGDIVVESALGKGSTFTLTLPLPAAVGSDVERKASAMEVSP